MFHGGEQGVLGEPCRGRRSALLQQSSGFVERKKKQLIPTEKGLALFWAMPDQLKSAKLTAEWEDRLFSENSPVTATRPFFKREAAIFFVSSLNRWLNGISTPNAYQLREIAHYFGMPYDWFLEDGGGVPNADDLADITGFYKAIGPVFIQDSRSIHALRDRAGQNQVIAAHNGTFTPPSILDNLRQCQEEAGKSQGGAAPPSRDPER